MPSALPRCALTERESSCNGACFWVKKVTVATASSPSILCEGLVDERKSPRNACSLATGRPLVGWGCRIRSPAWPPWVVAHMARSRCGCYSVRLWVPSLLRAPRNGRLLVLLRENMAPSFLLCVCECVCVLWHTHSHTAITGNGSWGGVGEWGVRWRS